MRILCRVLSVSVGGFYAWVKRPASAREREDGALSKQITSIYQQHQGRYGSPRIHAQLRDEGVHIGYKRVVRLMKQAGLAARHRTHRVVTTRADPTATPAENVLDRDFEAEEPNQKWVCDVTYIGTVAGWLYLAAVLDLYSRRVVGWAMAAKQDEELVHQALRMAVTHRQPGTGLLHHSDRGEKSYQPGLPDLPPRPRYSCQHEPQRKLLG